jgi:tRNA pseudouridine38-40 synthase
MPNFRLLLEYDGSEFEGWQAQAGDKRTVQGCLAGALERVTGAPAQVTGAGRTDAGVHAQGQVASARVETRLDADTLRRALNGVLPPDLVVLEAAVARDDFHPLREARRKLYRYRIWNGAVRSPLRRHRCLYVAQPLDLPAMRRAAAALVGERDFAAFRAAGSSARTSVRTLTRVELRGEAGAEVEIEVEGTGFLRHMVRNLVGTLVEVGKGRRDVDSMPALLASGDRRRAGPTAPARGLCLVRADTGARNA